MAGIPLREADKLSGADDGYGGIEYFCGQRVYVFDSIAWGSLMLHISMIRNEVWIF